MEPEKKSNGALFGLIIIVIILVIGGIYIWVSNKNMLLPPKTTQDQSGTVTNQDSSDLDTLQQDLDTADINVNTNINSVN